MGLQEAGWWRDGVMEHVQERLGMTYAAELLIISQTHSEKT